MRSSIKLYSLSYNNLKTYLVTLLLISGNIIFPQICHLLPGGGLVWLPIYFFTLIGAYKYGLNVGLLIAILSPAINSLIFNMPEYGHLPLIITRSILLAIIASYAARKFYKISLLIVSVIVLSYHFFGTFAEWFINKDFYIAMQNMNNGLPGVLVQIFIGYSILRSISRL